MPEIPGQDGWLNLLRLSAFRALWAGDALARVAYQVSLFILPLLAVTVLRVSAFQLGMISASQFVPVLVWSLVAGATAGRVTPRRLLVACNLIRGAAIAALSGADVLAHIDVALVILTAVAVGSATIFYDVGYQSTVPRVLGDGRLVSGNGLLQLSYSVALAAGPAIAGVLLQAAGALWATALIGAAFGAAASCYGFMWLEDGPGASPYLRHCSVADGLRFTWGCRPIRDLCVQSGLFNLHEQAFLTVFLLYAVRDIHVTAGRVGLIIGIGSLGAVAGSLATGKLSSRLHAGTTVTTALLVSAVALLTGRVVAGLALPEVAFAVAFFCNGFAQSAYNIFAASLRQTMPSPKHLGSVTASYRLVAYGTIPLGAMTGGMLTSRFGPGLTLFIIAASMTISSTTLIASPLRRIQTVEQSRRLVAAPAAHGVTPHL